MKFNDYIQFAAFLNENPDLFPENESIRLFKRNLHNLKTGCECNSALLSSKVNKSYLDLKFSEDEMNNLKSQYEFIEFYHQTRKGPALFLRF